MTTTSAGTDLAAVLQAALPDSSLVTDGDVLASLSHDDAEWAEVGRPVAALRARSTVEVQGAAPATATCTRC